MHNAVCSLFLNSYNTRTHLGGALPVKSKGGIGRVSVNTGREVAIVNIPLQRKIFIDIKIPNSDMDNLTAQMTKEEG